MNDLSDVGPRSENHDFRKMMLDNWPDPNYAGWRQDAEWYLDRIEAQAVATARAAEDEAYANGTPQP